MRFIILLSIIIFAGCSKPAFKSKWIKAKAPETFQVRFETSKGNFDVNITRSLSPAGVDRFYQLVTHHYFDRAIFYRVVPDFVAQFGNTDSVIARKWEKYKVPDEPVIGKNTRGVLSYTRSGKETRNGDLYFNLKDNFKLDTLNSNGVKGFPPFGTVISGLAVVDSLYAGYINKPMRSYDTMFINRRLFLSMYPKLDTIRKVYRIKTQ